MRTLINNGTSGTVTNVVQVTADNAKSKKAKDSLKVKVKDDDDDGGVTG